jgi:hypothetical protein
MPVVWRGLPGVCVFVCGLESCCVFTFAFCVDFCIILYGNLLPIGVLPVIFFIHKPYWSPPFCLTPNLILFWSINDVYMWSDMLQYESPRFLTFVTHFMWFDLVIILIMVGYSLCLSLIVTVMWGNIQEKFEFVLPCAQLIVRYSLSWQQSPENLATLFW